MLEALKIVLVSVAAAILYGEIHDQVTAHLCVEYFSVAHPHVVTLETPEVLALVWGVLATWWVGLGLGVPLAFAARVGSKPPLAWRDLVRPIGVLLGVMAAASLALGVVGYLMAGSRGFHLVGYLAQRIARPKHALFYADAFAHSAAYGVGLLGGLVLCVETWLRRRRAPGASPRARRIAAAVLFVLGVAGTAGLLTLVKFGMALGEGDLRAGMRGDLNEVLDALALSERLTGKRPRDRAEAFAALARPFTTKDGKAHGPLVAESPLRSWRATPAPGDPVSLDFLSVVESPSLAILAPWGTPLCYERGTSAPRVWSAGPDGVDDGGQGDDVVPR